MTREEMINEILNEVNWSDDKKASYRKSALNKKRKRIEEIYNVFVSNRNNALFCACLLG